jgi:hypothetical protein
MTTLFYILSNWLFTVSKTLNLTYVYLLIYLPHTGAIDEKLLETGDTPSFMDNLVSHHEIRYVTKLDKFTFYYSWYSQIFDTAIP